MATAMLSFKLGPVQPFIEAARTLRDLWSGSYLLSWLAAHGMKALFGRPGVTFITPDASPDANPLLQAVLNGATGNEDATVASLPHTFAAEVPATEAADLRQAVLDAVNAEWKRIAERVKAALDQRFHKIDSTWAANWDAQVNSHFEFVCVTLPLDGATDPVMNRLAVKPDTSQGTDEAKVWGRQWNFLGGLLDAARSVRHVPAYSPAGGDKHPVKCSLLGSYEQMGPGDLRESRGFWERAVKATEDGFRGTRLQSADKLSAVSLVKRFAWPVYWREKLGLTAGLRRLSDTATMAARGWLADGEAMDPDELRDDHGSWNGQWLHWAVDDQGAKDGDPKRPAAVRDRIAVKSAAQQRRPPAYFALLHLDGDNMGQVFQGDTGRQFGHGLERFRKITQNLTGFALADVRRIVAEKNGELIYAGGDDVLAFLPTETAVECARKLREKFGEALPGATLSGGIAVVHYKEDLRFALGQVRKAERAAKKVSRVTPEPDKPRKDAFAVTVCRRSGEHSTVVMGWDETGHLQQLVTAFRDGASDRWAYKLREELTTLIHLPLEAGRAEAMRLVGRGEFGGKEKQERFEAVIERLFEAYREQMTDPTRNWPAPDVLAGFVTLVQTASFLARGRE